jgi:hypothetical protein
MRRATQEHASSQSAEVRQNSPKSGVRATAGATGHDEGIKSSLPTDLQSIVDVWGQLPEAVRAGMVAMAKAASISNG